jgi:predicted permease
MADTVEALILDLLEWLIVRDRTYEEVMDAWRTSCPRLPVWEDANDRGLITREEVNGNYVIRVTSSGLPFSPKVGSFDPDGARRGLAAASSRVSAVIPQMVAVNLETLAGMPSYHSRASGGAGDRRRAGGQSMTGFAEDLRLAFRTLARRPGFSAVIVATLGLAIGANAAVFSFVDAILLRPLPLAAPERLVRIYSHFASGLDWGSVSYPNYLDYERANHVFTALAAEGNQGFIVGDGASGQLVVGALVSANYFETLGVKPALGRAFVPAEDGVASPVAIIGDGFWKRHFGADPRVLGRSVTLNGTGFRVVGVAPAGFTGPNTGLLEEIWAPLSMSSSMQKALTAGSDLLRERDGHWLQVTGRLRPGVSLRQAADAMNVIASQLRRLYPRANEGISLTLLPESEASIYPAMRGGVVALSALLQGVVGLVLLVACANAAGLFLARGSARRREIGIRLAVGARISWLVRLLVSESLVLGLAGGAVGLALAFWATRVLSSLRLPMQIPISLPVEFDARVLILTLGLALLTGVLFGLLPALQIIRPRLAMALRDGGAGTGMRRSSMQLRGILVIAQIAATFVLLVGAGLFFRSLGNAEATELGFRAEGLLVASLNLGYAGYDEKAGPHFLERIETRLRELPGVSAVSLATRLPFSVRLESANAAPEGYVPRRPGDGAPQVAVNAVAPDYFATMQIRLAAGREFTVADQPGKQPVVVINEALVQRFFAGDPPAAVLGKRLVVSGTPHVIVGVARDAKQLSLKASQEPYLYLDLFQHYEPAVAIHLRSAGDPASLIAALRREVRALDPRVTLYEVKPIARQLELPLLPQRMAVGLLAAMGSLALLLALVGLYGATAYALSRRTREIGIRIALGADHRQLLALVLRDGVVQCGLGVAIGLAIAFAVNRLAASLLFGVNPVDPAILLITAVLVSALALAANLVPALSAIQLDPKQALSAE